ncbi:MAG TPA: ATP-dependent DNA helicase [Lacunisphaera sp.]|nr:ATP-dependent DNA helicase [Lacunisphaera sp.]
MIGLIDDSGRGAGNGSKPSRVREVVEALFCETGVLCDALNLEHRPEQEQMASVTAGALYRDEPLLFEAGTGVGKSLAYLIPGIIHAVDQGRQLIVSTHTISLQEQIEQKDLPICRRVFKAAPDLARYADFRSTVLVGKSNYLCPTRLESALNDSDELLISTEKDELKAIAKWAKETRTGLRHELQPKPSDEVWELVCADSAGCSKKYCSGKECFYQAAKARCENAQVLIVNHSLLFALIHVGEISGSNPKRGVIHANDFVVLDEAHTIPEVATDNFGLTVSSGGLDRMLRSLFNPKKKKGFLRKLDDPGACLATEDCLEASRQFFEFIHDRLVQIRPILRVREKGFAEPWLDEPLNLLHARLAYIDSKLPDGKLRDELREKMKKVASYRASISNFLNLSADGHVYWAELTGKRKPIVHLRSAPIEVAAKLREVLFSRATSVVCTSATLAMGGSIEPFALRIGADDAQAMAVKSPFDFDKNMRVFVASDVPLPSPKEAKLAIETLTDYIRFCTDKVRGGSLVLFTSYTDMRAVAAALEPGWRAAGRPFLMQGADLSRTEIADQMRKLGNAVLFGTDSFWTGVDVPGAALSQVIITRLPFDPPTHPITEAKCEHIRDAGGNPFNDLTLPDALIKFRQGIGRLIRNKSDRGTVTILDSRVLAKAYGREFLGSLPTQVCERMDLASRDRVFRPFP